VWALESLRPWLIGNIAVLFAQHWLVSVVSRAKESANGVALSALILFGLSAAIVLAIMIFPQKSGRAAGGNSLGSKEMRSTWKIGTCRRLLLAIVAGAYFYRPGHAPAGQPTLIELDSKAMSGFTVGIQPRRPPAFASSCCFLRRDPLVCGGPPQSRKFLQRHPEDLDGRCSWWWEPILPTDWRQTGPPAPWARLSDGRGSAILGSKSHAFRRSKEGAGDWKSCTPTAANGKGFLWDLTAAYGAGNASGAIRCREPMLINGPVVRTTSEAGCPDSER